MKIAARDCKRVFLKEHYDSGKCTKSTQQIINNAKQYIKLFQYWIDQWETVGKSRTHFFLYVYGRATTFAMITTKAHFH